MGQGSPGPLKNTIRTNTTYLAANTTSIKPPSTWKSVRLVSVMGRKTDGTTGIQYYEYPKTVNTSESHSRLPPGSRGGSSPAGRSCGRPPELTPPSELIQAASLTWVAHGEAVAHDRHAELPHWGSIARGAWARTAPHPGVGRREEASRSPELAVEVRRSPEWASPSRRVKEREDRRADVRMCACRMSGEGERWFGHESG